MKKKTISAQIESARRTSSATGDIQVHTKQLKTFAEFAITNFVWQSILPYILYTEYSITRFGSAHFLLRSSREQSELTEHVQTTRYF